MSFNTENIVIALKELGRDNGGKGYSEQHLSLFTEIVNKVVELNGNTEVNIPVSESSEYKELQNKLEEVISNNKKISEECSNKEEELSKLKHTYNQLFEASKTEQSDKKLLEDRIKELESQVKPETESVSNGMELVQIFPKITDGTYVKVKSQGKELKGFFTNKSEFTAIIKTYQTEEELDSKLIENLEIVD